MGMVVVMILRSHAIMAKLNQRTNGYTIKYNIVKKNKIYYVNKIVNVSIIII